MGSFDASLRTIGDRRALPATITVDGGRIKIIAGDLPIGDWALEEVHLEPTGGAAYRMAAEGEQILLEVPDTDAFQSAIEARSRMPRRPKVRTARTPRAKAKTDHPKPALPQVEVAVTGRPTGKAADTSGLGTKEPGALDRVLAVAERRWGSLLPSWVFTRPMAVTAVVVLVLTVVFPGLVSSFLLMSGLLLVLIGAVAYTDVILAAKWLPGRMTAMHVLLFGVALVMLGVLVGVVA